MRSAALHACPWLSYSAPLALSPGYHIARLWRSVLAVIFRAFGAQPWLSHRAPLALSPGYHIARLWRSVLAITSRAFGAQSWLSYSAPLALSAGYHIPRLWRSVPTFVQTHQGVPGGLALSLKAIWKMRAACSLLNSRFFRSGEPAGLIAIRRS